MDQEERQRLLEKVVELEKQRDEDRKRAQKIQQQLEQLEQLQQLQQQTTFRQYIQNCHSMLFQSLAVCNGSMSVTDVRGKFYPYSLRNWEEFKGLQQHEFEFLRRILKDEPLFPSHIEVGAIRRHVRRIPVASEEDIKPFEHLAVEAPVEDVISALCKDTASNPSVADLDITSISFANHSLTITPLSNDATQSNIEESAKKQPGTSPREQVETGERKKIIPDRRCLRYNKEGDRSIAFVVEYKAAHLLEIDHVRRGLGEHLFASVIKRTISSKSSNDKIQQSKDDADDILAKVLTQTYNYMIRFGVEYSYLTSGRLFLFLWVKADDPATLYYHLAVPGDEAEDENGEICESDTAVAQVLGFSLLALRAPTRSHEWVLNAQAGLSQWPIPYPDWTEVERETTDEEELSRTSSSSSDPSFKGKDTIVSPHKMKLRSRSTSKIPDTRGPSKDADDADDSNDSFSGNPSSINAGLKGKSSSSSRSSGNSSSKKSSNTKNQSRSYCTLACLVGLKRGRELDVRCPNVASHRLSPESRNHALDVESLTSLLQKQMACSMSVDCEPLELKGMYGAVGSLFKLTLTQYGYTFVGKGTIRQYIPYLRREAEAYRRLEVLQGECVPVVLGSIDLAQPYYLTARHALQFAGMEIVHMLLMSWAGEKLKDGDMDTLETDIESSLSRVRGEGVLNSDVRAPNLLWNEELGRVMVIDFHQAHIIPPRKPKQLERLTRRKRSSKGYEKVESRKRLPVASM